jgi:hypothetical protein
MPEMAFNENLRRNRALSFSKKLAHHIGALKMFIGHYNLMRATV